MRHSSRYFNFYSALGLIIVVTLGVSAQSYFLGAKSYGGGPEIYQHYNNYIIFKQSFFHLLDNVNLYIPYPKEQFDLYKYSPTFALLMAPLAMLPDGLGLSFWNLLNSLVLFFALWKCKAIPEKYKFWAVLFVLVELVTSMQNAQSNALMAGLMIMGFNLLENKKTFWAVLLLSLTVYIKIFGIVAFVLILFYPSRWRAMLYGVFWFAMLAVLPIFVVRSSDLLLQYQYWGVMLQQDHDASLGISVAGFLSSVFHWQHIKAAVLAVGAFLFVLPLVSVKRYQNESYRFLYLASVLLWVVIFNHKAESPTFVIAVAGVAVWYFLERHKRFGLRHLLLLLVLLFTSLSSTDLFPKVVRLSFIQPYNFKVLPCILVWLWIWLEQMKMSTLKLHTNLRR